MSVSFAANLSNLRRERNLTQKTAAEELGISQALLSHYEKGIRECNLDFVIKAAVYYDVTTDYLLGLSESRHGSNELFEQEEIPSDSQIKTKTLLRAFFYLLHQAENENEISEMNFNDFFTLAIKKYISLTHKNDKSMSSLCDFAINTLKSSKKSTQTDTAVTYPLYLKTVDDHAKNLISKKFAKTID
ncbi:MAG: helix-turn-helix transcriptional regulator [Clostridia bacterium]|nr:helix-turn-helix transcriptional regulator [Clostridia bacterium]